MWFALKVELHASLLIGCHGTVTIVFQIHQTLRVRGHAKTSYESSNGIQNQHWKLEDIRE